MPGIALFNQRPQNVPNASTSHQEKNVAAPTEGNEEEEGFGLDEFGLDNNDGNEFGVDGEGITTNDDDFGFLSGVFGGVDGQEEEEQENYDDFNMNFGEIEDSDEPGDLQQYQAKPASNDGGGGGGGISLFQTRHDSTPSFQANGTGNGTEVPVRATTMGTVKHDSTNNAIDTSTAPETINGDQLRSNAASLLHSTKNAPVPQMNQRQEGQITQGSSPNLLRKAAPLNVRLVSHVSPSQNGTPTFDHQNATTKNTGPVPRTYPFAAIAPPETPVPVNRAESNQASMQRFATTPPLNQPITTSYRGSINAALSHHTMVTPMNTKMNTASHGHSPHRRTVLPMPISEKKQVPQGIRTMAPPAPRPTVLGKPSIGGQGVYQANVSTTMGANVGVCNNIQSQNNVDPHGDWQNHQTSEPSYSTRNDENFTGLLQAEEASPFRLEESPKDVPFKMTENHGTAQGHYSSRREPVQTQQSETTSTREPSSAPKATVKPLADQSFDELFAAFDSHLTSAIDKDKAFRRGYLETRLSVGAATAGVLKMQGLEMAFTMEIANDIEEIDKLLSECAK